LLITEDYKKQFPIHPFQKLAKKKPQININTMQTEDKIIAVESAVNQRLEKIGQVMQVAETYKPNTNWLFRFQKI